MLQMSPRHLLNTHQKIRYTKFTVNRVHLRRRNEVQQMGIYVTVIQASSNRSVKVLVWLDHKDFRAKCLDLTWHIMEIKALRIVSTWTEGNIPWSWFQFVRVNICRTTVLSMSCWENDVASTIEQLEITSSGFQWCMSHTGPCSITSKLILWALFW